jgi:hypothetical protein
MTDNSKFQQHYAQAERIRANCALCGKKLTPHYDQLGVLLFWTHKKRQTK